MSALAPRSLLPGITSKKEPPAPAPPALPLPFHSRRGGGGMRASDHDAGLRSDTTVPPAGLRFPWGWLLVGPRGRIVVYALVLTNLASVCCFYRLSEGTLRG